ncbi:MAG: hypothetical protein IJH40_07640 [Ruminococcus sp.]|uniref:glycoside hydrolase family 3 N-terminal domain-containing protein n=1 Tax=Ruminococcus sp. TaxID=41978 RepID=UPI0028730002|nr:glycoside hydrolase family 3 N-terminal domain-containing protein [Ruminococcus sp.]MBQ3285497.1 hypothetical protein [Ruminococcus sp.]
MADKRDNRKRLSSDERKGGLDSLSPKKIKIADKVDVSDTADTAKEANDHVRRDASDDLVDQIIAESSERKHTGASVTERPKTSWQSKTVDPSDTRRHTRKEYDARKGEHRQKKSHKALIIVLIALVLAAIGVFALIYFVIAPNASKPADTPTEAPAPTQAIAAATKDEVDPTAPTESEFESAASAALKNMSRREKICQLFIVTPEVLTDEQLVTEAGDKVKGSLDSFPVGGVLFSPRNFSGDEQASKLISDTQSYAKFPLFISVDDDGMISLPQNTEGGPESGPQGGPQGAPEGGPQGAPQGGPEGGPQGGPQSGNAPSMDSDATPESAYSNALDVSKAKHEIGFNLDFSLVADISEAIDGDDPDFSVDSVGELVRSAVKGYKEGGVIPSIKYFPGQETHSEEAETEGFPHLTRSLEDIDQSDLHPFRSGVGEGVDVIVVDHVIVDKLDPDTPATLSETVVPQLLRDKLGFGGVTVSDNMSADIIMEKYDYSDVVKGLFAADIDMILNPDSMSSYITAIEDALDKGDITEKQLDTKVMRVLTLKYKSGVVPQEDE